MGHYTISYTGLDTATANRKACIDTLQYLGAKRFKIFARLLRSNCKLRQAYFYLGFVGVSGFPMLAICKRYHARYNRMFCSK